MNDHGPTVQDYLDWAQDRGCEVEITPLERDGRVLLAVLIRAPSGGSVSEIVSELGDPLMSTTIARLDRRLGMKSHLYR